MMVMQCALFLTLSHNQDIHFTPLCVWNVRSSSELSGRHIHSPHLSLSKAESGLFFFFLSCDFDASHFTCEDETYLQMLLWGLRLHSDSPLTNGSTIIHSYLLVLQLGGTATSSCRTKSCLILTSYSVWQRKLKWSSFFALENLFFYMSVASFVKTEMTTKI